ncbi:MAG: 2-hydroxyacyl-CoA dehydratase family protein [Thermodesulfobacteriota bacterium]|nr:2-hydroxyacyl-CoA dehydratase family protein [Thermodesulfobacteriota bacterium]
MFEKFTDKYKNRHEYAREWKKRTGGKVVGFLCSYAPEEILYAAGILPVRLLGAHESSDLVEKHMASNIACSFCRDCLGQGLEGKYDYLDGIVQGQTCLHTGEVFWVWQKHIPMDFSYFLGVPHSTQSVGRFEYLAKEYKDFKAACEKWIGKPITDEDLDKAIDAYNTNRRLIREIFAFRKKDDPLVTGAEALDLALSGQIMDREEHNEMMKETLRDLPNRQMDRETGERLMIVGSINTDREFMKLVEEELDLPATVVIDDTCTGIRYNFNDITPQEDRLMAISIRYNHRPPCPNKDWPKRRRTPFINHLIKEYKVDAVILFNHKFCQPHQLDNVYIEEKLKEQGIPTLQLEFDIRIPKGQIRTRVEALLETLMDII